MFDVIDLNPPPPHILSMMSLVMLYTHTQTVVGWRSKRNSVATQLCVKTVSMAPENAVLLVSSASLRAILSTTSLFFMLYGYCIDQAVGRC